MTVKCIAQLQKSSEAFDLPEGQLLANFGFNIIVSFSSEDVLEAARILIDKGDNKDLTSQAGIIARAGKHGWGLGDIYSTF
jgi:hypothetical protein